MSFKLIIAGALLLLCSACMVSPYGEGPGYRGANYSNPGHGGYYENGGYGECEGFRRGGEERHEVHDGGRWSYRG